MRNIYCKIMSDGLLMGPSTMKKENERSTIWLNHRIYEELAEPPQKVGKMKDQPIKYGGVPTKTFLFKGYNLQPIFYRAFKTFMFHGHLGSQGI